MATRQGEDPCMHGLSVPCAKRSAPTSRDKSWKKRCYLSAMTGYESVVNATLDCHTSLSGRDGTRRDRAQMVVSLKVQDECEKGERAAKSSDEDEASPATTASAPPTASRFHRPTCRHVKGKATICLSKALFHDSRPEQEAECSCTCSCEPAT